MTPLITTIIPTFRRPELLKKAVQSTQNQIFKNIKICIYDNASEDETEKTVQFLQKTDDRIHYIKREKNIGSFENFQDAMRRIDTPFFSFLSDDDQLLPDFYESALKEFEKYPDAMFSAGDTLLINLKGKKIAQKGHDKNGFFQAENGIHIISKNTFTWTGILFRKEVIEKIGLLDPEVELASDLDYLFRIAKEFPFVYKSEPYALFLMHENQAGNKEATEKRIRSLEKFLQKHHDFFEKNPQAQSIHYRHIGTYSAIGGDMQKAKESLKKAWKLDKAPKNLLRLFLAYLGKKAYLLAFKLKSRI